MQWVIFILFELEVNARTAVQCVTASDGAAGWVASGGRQAGGVRPRAGGRCRRINADDVA